MNTLLPPEAWRSEAFAEDLPEDVMLPPPLVAPHGRLMPTLLGVLPLALAAAGAVAAVWSGA
jgi:hypothetical protein